MNINKINDFIKMIGLFLLANITGLLFLSGLGVIIYTFFRISINIGFFSLGAGLILVALIIISEKPR